MSSSKRPSRGERTRPRRPLSDSDATADEATSSQLRKRVHSKGWKKQGNPSRFVRPDLSFHADIVI